jgi:uncharacterized NAD(P)/FAD-binding protein YdhS
VRPTWLSSTIPSTCDLAIIGGGFVGMTTLVGILAERPEARIVLLERHPRRGPGVAYGGCEPHHLLNVPAGRMGATAADPGAFHAWLEKREPGRWSATDFAPRARYGEYLMELVDTALARHDVVIARESAVRLETTPRHVELLLGSGDSLRASAVLLAPGLPQARPPWRGLDDDVPAGFLVGDPWAPGALDGIHPERAIALVGSGLTAIDVVSSLRRRGHRGMITMISRSGRLPLAHASAAVQPATYSREELAKGAVSAMRAVRAAAMELSSRGLPWQGAIDGIRSQTAATWSAWSAEDRARFVRHMRSLWEIHRHRAPSHLLDDLEAQRRAGTLSIIRGQVRGLAASGAHLRVAVEPDPGAVGLTVARLINCAGPAQGIRQTIDPLLSSLLHSGLGSTDDLGIGLRTDPTGRLLRDDGTANERVWLVGALRKGDLWESTAVPELRTQVAQAVEGVSGLL